MLKIQAVQAAFGDCFIVRYGTAAAPRFMLIDGGPKGNFNAHLKTALRQIKSAGHDLDLVVLSHVDIDHVAGLNDYLSGLRAGATNLPAAGALWHNSFSQTIAEGTDIESRFKSLMSVQGAQSIAHAGIAVQGVAEGHKLRLDAQVLQIPVNDGFPDGLILVDTAPNPITLDNLTITVVGPTEANLAELRKKWEKWLEENEDAVGRGDLGFLANSDNSVPNLSSVMFLIEGDGKTVLFTGDGRSDHLLDGLGQAGLLDSEGKLHVDVFKVGHHGSNRNVTKTFFRKVTANFYLISADGANDNPDFDTLKWIVEVAAEQSFVPTLLLTNSTPSLERLIQEFPPGNDSYLFKVLDSGNDWMTLDLS